jgi:hypothetical protein
MPEEEHLISKMTFNTNKHNGVLNLRKCKTNQDVLYAGPERVNPIPYIELLNEVEKRFIYQEPGQTLFIQAFRKHERFLRAWRIWQKVT